MGGAAGDDQSSCVQRVLQAIGVGGIAGGVLGAMKVTWELGILDSKPKISTLGQSLTKMRHFAVLYGTACVAYSATQCTVESFMGERTMRGSMLGGAMAGLVVGGASGKARVLWPAVGVLSVCMGMFEYNGHTFMNNPQYHRVLCIPGAVPLDGETDTIMRPMNEMRDKNLMFTKKADW